MIACINAGQDKKKTEVLKKYLSPQLTLLLKTKMPV